MFLLSAAYLVTAIIWRSIWVRSEWIKIHPTRLFLYSRPVLLPPGCLTHAALGTTLEEDANMFVHFYSISLLVLCFQFTVSFQIPKVQSRYYLWVLRLDSWHLFLVLEVEQIVWDEHPHSSSREKKKPSKKATQSSQKWIPKINLMNHSPEASVILIVREAC